MMRILAGLGVGMFVGDLPGLVIPLQVFTLACLMFLALVVPLFFPFHPGWQDFQKS